MLASRTLIRRALALPCIALAAGLAACDALLVEPDDSAIRFSLMIADGGAAGGSAEAFDAVDRIRIRIHAGQDVVDEIELDFDSEGGDVSIPIRAPARVDGVPITIEVALSRGTDLLFTGQGSLTPDGAGNNTAEIVLQPVAAGVLITPATFLFEAFGESATFRAAAVFATGDTIDGAAITFRAVSPGIVDVQSSGVATARAQGTTAVEARFGEAVAEAQAEVRQRVTDIQVQRAPTSLAAGASFVIDALLRDRNGFPVLGRTVQWTSSDPTVLVIDDGNVARAVGSGTVTVTGAIDGATTSFQVVVAAIPITPSGLVATAQGTVVSLVWRDNAGDETGYQVLWRPAASGAFAPLAMLSANATTFTGNTFAADARFDYVVRACNGQSCSDDSNVATVATVPATPSSTSIDLDSFSYILTITWSDTNTETFFILERDNDGVAWIEQDRPPAGVTQVDIDANLDFDAPYTSWRVLACNAAGCSQPTPSFSWYSYSGKPPAAVRRVGGH